MFFQVKFMDKSMDIVLGIVDNTASVAFVCHLAMNSGEPGQARKGAAVVVISCAGNGWRKPLFLSLSKK